MIYPLSTIWAIWTINIHHLTPYIVIELHHDFLPLAICSGIRIFFVVSFVFISSEFRQTFRRVLCGKTFCHNILPQKKIVKISSKISLLQFKFWRNPNEILTKEFVAKSCGKTFCHKAPDEKSDEILTKWKRKKQQRKSLYQNILQVVGNHGGVRSQLILYLTCFLAYTLTFCLALFLA